MSSRARFPDDYDFTLTQYARYLEAIQRYYQQIMCFADFLQLTEMPECFCLIRHDVDRKPLNALRMAELEQRMGISSTYYFRVKRHTFDETVIQRIHGLGHEIGYHYESLSDSGGDSDKAFADFSVKLQQLRQLVPISTVSMHGRPLSRYDNRNMWRHPQMHARLRAELSLLGEIYLDIDYGDIHYIGDTGRNWERESNNLRDKVDSAVRRDFTDGDALLRFLSDTPSPRMVFQVHPERWTDSPVEWWLQSAKDGAINCVKRIMR